MRIAVKRLLATGRIKNTVPSALLQKTLGRIAVYGVERYLERKPIFAVKIVIGNTEH